MNVTDHIQEMTKRMLLHKQQHPLCLLKTAIEGYFKSFVITYPTYPVVTVQANFDDLLIPEDHPSRSLKDTFYTDEDHVLRTHTSAHQTENLRAGHKQFLVLGDCYRRDTIDATHYPVFHQLEGIKVEKNWSREEAEVELKMTIEYFLKYLLPEIEDMRWTDSYFPFTDPSFELEILYRGDWLEILGCGLVQKKILENCGLGDHEGWAFGFGLERLAMVRYKIPDIRLFWTEDERFLGQFEGKTWHDDFVFESYSVHPPCNKDISFWCGPQFHENDLMAIIREHGGDLVEEVKLLDEFEKDGRKSLAYRIVYRSMDRSLTNGEINEIQSKVRDAISNLDLELR